MYWNSMLIREEKNILYAFHHELFASKNIKAKKVFQFLLNAQPKIAWMKPDCCKFEILFNPVKKANSLRIQSQNALVRQQTLNRHIPLWITNFFTGWIIKKLLVATLELNFRDDGVPMRKGNKKTKQLKRKWKITKENNIR